MSQCIVRGCPNSERPVKASSEGFKFHGLPADPIARAAWIELLGIDERSAKRRRVTVCSLHFEEEDYNYSWCGARSTPKEMALPTKNLPEDPGDKLKRKQMLSKVLEANPDDKEDLEEKDPLCLDHHPTFEREQSETPNTEEIEIKLEPEEALYDSVESDGPSEILNFRVIKIKSEANEASCDSVELLNDQSVTSNIEEIRIKPEPEESSCDSLEILDDEATEKKFMVNGSTQTERIPKDRLIMSYNRMGGKQVLYFTEFTPDQFMSLFSFLKKVSGVSSTIHKFTSIQIIDQLLLTLYKYRFNDDFIMIGVLFSVVPQTAKNIFEHWCSIINKGLKNIDFWSLGKTDGGRYRVCLHIVKVPRPMTAENKFKCLIGINEGGIIIFCSKLLDDRLSLNEVFHASNVIDLLSEGDTILTSQDYGVTKLLKSKGIALNVIPFLGNNYAPKKNYIGAKEFIDRKIHVDRLKNVLTIYRILVDPVNKDLLPIYSTIVFNCAMLCNFKPKLNK